MEIRKCKTIITRVLISIYDNYIIIQNSILKKNYTSLNISYFLNRQPRAILQKNMEFFLFICAFKYIYFNHLDLNVPYYSINIK